MWIGAMDERLRVSVPVVSVGSFESFVTNCNCICETLPGGLSLTEEWGILALTAPRSVLVLNAIKDSITFGPDPMTRTCRLAQEIYDLHGVSAKFDFRSLNLTHGYWPDMLRAMLGWMEHMLMDAPSGAPQEIPHYTPLDESLLLCFKKGERPEGPYSYAANRRTLLKNAGENTPPSAIPDTKRQELRAIVGWTELPPAELSSFRATNVEKTQATILQSPRQIPLPIIFRKGDTDEVHLILSSEGKNSSFVLQNWKTGNTSRHSTITADLPGTGEMGWEIHKEGGSSLHDTSRAALWLGYTIIGEWAECIAHICQSVQKTHPAAKIKILAENEMAFATLVAMALHPIPSVTLALSGLPESLHDIAHAKTASMSWMVPSLLTWGDIDLLEKLAQ